MESFTYFFRAVVYLKWSLSGLDLIAYLFFHGEKKEVKGK